jgi:predicted ribosomally synthesized peptide with nif11-like leader
MSLESATQFLNAATQDEAIREKFIGVQSPDGFLSRSQQLGYDFTPTELKQVVAEQSHGILIRRKTGVWKWLRDVAWM